jgi:hypothetical protein
MKKIVVKKENSSMVWFGSMPEYLDVQVQNLKNQGFEIVAITD